MSTRKKTIKMFYILLLGYVKLKNFVFSSKKKDISFVEDSGYFLKKKG